MQLRISTIRRGESLMKSILRNTLFLSIGLLIPTYAQVTTATLTGTVTDSTGGSIPAATVTITHMETNASNVRTTGPSGEFAFDFIRIGTYSVSVEAKGFKRQTSRGLEIAAGQTVRPTFVLEIGSIAESVNVEASAPQINTTTSEQVQTFEGQKVTELPLGRRNISNILSLSAGVDSGSGRSPRLNGLGATGTGISVDGTDANSNPEQKSMSQYGARNYIDVMSIDAVAEVQVVRGILPAEYGSVVGGQVNLISKSGTNNWHGTLFENYQSHLLNARGPFTAARTATGGEIRKPRLVFNQFGGTLGAPIIKDRVFGFFTYEGYRESASRRVTGTTPTQSFRDEILKALPFQETKILLAAAPLPTSPINADIGTVEAIRNSVSHDNHMVFKGDARLTNTSNLAFTYTRMRPYGLDPNYLANGANDRTFNYISDRISSSYTTGAASWTSESRFGWNFNDMKRLDAFFNQKDPLGTKEIVPWGRSIPTISIAGTSGFGLASAEIWDMNGSTYTFDQKISIRKGKHALKFGAKYALNTGFRSNPQNPAFSFANKADFLANIASGVTPSFGAPPYKSAMHELGFFIQDDWRVTSRLVLNLGVRYDFYTHNVSEPTTNIPVGFYNLTPPKDWSKFDFGPATDPKNPYNNDGWVNLGPRIGFAYDVDGKGKTVVRGGFAILFSPNVPGVVRQSVADPVVPFRVNWSTAEVKDLGLKFPRYSDQLRQVVQQQVAATGTRFLFSAINPGLQNPYAMHYQFNIQRAITSTLMVESGYVGNRGVKFILHRTPNLPDRNTGIRPNPKLVFGGYYVDNSQNTSYNAWQTSVRKRFSHGFSYDGHYTFSKTLGVSGGDIGAYYGADNSSNNIQNFDNPRADRGPNGGDATHRMVADWIYEVPRFTGANRLMRSALGGWEVSGIFNARSGGRDTVTMSCTSGQFCRPDYLGGSTSFANWKENGTTRCIVGARCTIQYLNPAAFALVPLSPISKSAIRPGNLGQGSIRGPATWSMDASVSRNFKIGEKTNLQFRADMFNATNHVNYSGPTTSLNSATFGQISGTGSMRVIQLNGKLRF